jgi:hypothetical protein
MHFKASLKTFWLINIAIVSIAAAGLAVYDPLHILHKPWVTEGDRLHGNMRLQAAGIINNYDFDSVIVGTSMMKGTSAIQASEKLGAKFVNLSTDGSSTMERKYIIEYALRKKDIRNIIISFDTGLDQNLKTNKKFPIEKYSFLYDDNVLNDVKAYWNDKFIFCLVKWSRAEACVGESRELQRPIEWFDKIHKVNENISGIENWVKNEKGRGKAVTSRISRHLKHPTKSKAKYDEKLKLTREIIDDSLFSLIKENEGVSFHVVFPPYSRFLYSLWKNKNPYKYQLYLETMRYLVVEGAQYKNLKVYSFDDMAYLDDLNNYRDMRHYNTDMNAAMLDAIKEQNNIITIEGIEGFIDTIGGINTSYNLDYELNYLLGSYSQMNANLENKKLLSYMNMGWQESSFSVWKKRGDVVVVEDKAMALNQLMQADQINFKGKKASLYQVELMSVSAGDEAVGSVVLWSESPGRVRLQIARHCSKQEYEGGSETIELTQKPTRYTVYHKFQNAHDCIRLGILLAEKEASFYAWDARVRRN